MESSQDKDTLYTVTLTADRDSLPQTSTKRKRSHSLEQKTSDSANTSATSSSDSSESEQELKILEQKIKKLKNKRIKNKKTPKHTSLSSLEKKMETISARLDHLASILNQTQSAQSNPFCHYCKMIWATTSRTAEQDFD